MLESKRLHVQKGLGQTRGQTRGHAKRLVSRRQGMRISIAAAQKWLCQICGMPLPATFEIDHIVALSLGGQDTLTNLQALCPNCHRNKTIPEMQYLSDQIIEDQTGISKYFNPDCVSFYKVRPFL